MSAAATAAGYLFAHGRLPAAGHSTQVDAERPHQSQPVKETRTPRIEYRKRRYYPLPSAA